jgi:hypothetical protein
MELRRPTRSENAPDAVDTTPAALCETMQRIAVYLSGSALISGSCSAGDALRQQRERHVLFGEIAAHLFRERGARSTFRNNEQQPRRKKAREAGR